MGSIGFGQVGGAGSCEGGAQHIWLPVAWPLQRACSGSSLWIAGITSTALALQLRGKSPPSPSPPAVPPRPSHFPLCALPSVHFRVTVQRRRSDVCDASQQTYWML